MLNRHLGEERLHSYPHSPGLQALFGLLSKSRPEILGVQTVDRIQELQDQIRLEGATREIEREICVEGIATLQELSTRLANRGEQIREEINKPADDGNLPTSANTSDGESAHDPLAGTQKAIEQVTRDWLRRADLDFQERCRKAQESICSGVTEETLFPARMIEFSLASAFTSPARARIERDLLDWSRRTTESVESAWKAAIPPTVGPPSFENSSSRLTPPPAVEPGLAAISLKLPQPCRLPLPDRYGETWSSLRASPVLMAMFFAGIAAILVSIFKYHTQGPDPAAMRFLLFGVLLPCALIAAWFDSARQGAAPFQRKVNEARSQYCRELRNAVSIAFAPNRQTCADWIHKRERQWLAALGDFLAAHAKEFRAGTWNKNAEPQTRSTSRRAELKRLAEELDKTGKAVDAIQAQLQHEVQALVGPD